MDIDIDLQTTFDPLQHFSHVVRASMVQEQELKKHPAGVYFQKIPTDKITGLAAIPYDYAEQLGYIKFDFLHLSVLDYFDNKQQVRELIDKEPNWELLKSPSVVQKLFQIHRHFDIVNRIEPQSTEQLADTIALIRPSKRNLLDHYIKQKNDPQKLAEVRQLLYQKPTDGKYYFKKGHAVSYALTIVLQLHLIQNEIM